MVTFYDFPEGALGAPLSLDEPGGITLRGPQASDRRRQALKRVDPIAVIWKMLAEQRFRRLKAPELTVYLGAQYADGIAIESTAEMVAA